VGGKAPEAAAAAEEVGTRHGEVVVDVHGPEGEEGTHLVVVGKGTPDEDALKLQ